MQEADFKIKFDSNYHHVDATVLVSSLVHTTTLVQEINKSLNTGKKIEIKVKAFEKGSFLVHIELLESTLEVLKNIFTKDNISTGGAIIGGVVGIFELAKFLKGGKAEEVTSKEDKVVIKNNSGEVTVIDKVIYNIYETNNVVRESVSNTFRTLTHDPDVFGFEITDKNEVPMVRVSREEFIEIGSASKNNVVTDRVITESVKVVVIRPSFDNSLKWDILYRGKKESAKIIDPNFLTRIDNGEPFSKGDVLDIDLQITQKYDESLNAYIDKSYQINKIHHHIRREEQSKLDFDI